MVMDNICYLLNNFIHCSAYEHVIFCWVLHEQHIIDQILSNLDVTGCLVKNISLVCDPDTLRRRLLADVEQGLRREDVVTRSLQRLPFYNSLDTIRIDVSHITAKQAAQQLCKL